ncbi:hypothetical protein B0H10DRAFT_1203619 [Mycena sp. CBHHK59/15]|nr:hypothetical protein B0H10DRAFT_1203619 [Mycena sp. CBHHK59/15]
MATNACIRNKFTEIVRKRITNLILRAIASPDFVFRFDNLDEYWATLANSIMKPVRDALEHVGDGRIAPCVLSLLADRWQGQPVKLLKVVCQVLVCNLVFSAILMSVGAYRGRIGSSEDLKTVADNFEAYVAACARQFGTRRLRSWVFRAYGPLVDSIRSACIVIDFNPIPANPTYAPAAQPEKRKSVDDTEASQTRLKSQDGSILIPAVFGDRTNGQGRI